MKIKNKNTTRVTKKSRILLKTLYVSFRASSQELKRIDEVSAHCNMPRSTFVNRAVMDSIAQIEATKKPVKGQRSFVDMCRFIIGK